MQGYFNYDIFSILILLNSNILSQRLRKRIEKGGHGDSRLIHFTRAYHRCNLLFARKHYPAMRWYMLIRLWLRAVRDLNKTIRAADREAVALLEGRVQPFELSK
jgi:hypothetical protein